MGGNGNVHTLGMSAIDPGCVKTLTPVLDGLVERTGTDDMSAVRELACILCLPT